MMETRFELRTSNYDTVFNDHLSQKLEFIRNDWFNQYSNITQLFTRKPNC